MFSCIRVTFLYIGAIVGVGFSSGREIALFFGNLSPLNVALSGVFMAIFAGIFMMAGRSDVLPKGKSLTLCIFLACFVSVASMIAGGEFVMRELTGAPMFGLFLGIFAGTIVIYGIEKIKHAGLVLVPLIILSIAILFSKIELQTSFDDFSLLEPIAYSGLDVLLGGMLIAREGKRMKTWEIGASSILCAIFLSAILFMLQHIVVTDRINSQMPMLVIADGLDLKIVTGILIISAIFTTLVSSLELATDIVLASLKNKPTLLGKKISQTQDRRSVATFVILLLCYPLSFFGFDNLIDTFYPAISALGLVLLCVIILKFARVVLKRLISHKTISTHTDSLNLVQRLHLGKNKRI